MFINRPRVLLEEVPTVKEEIRSIFISYIELSKYLNCKDEESSRKIVSEMISNVSKLKFNEIILQVRSFSDAIYKSSVYPWSKVISSSEGVDPGFDLLEIFIQEANKKNISVLAWVNPYRVRNYADISDISMKSPAYKYLGTDTVYINNGVYFNPSKKEVTKMVVDGVKELVSNYNIKGIVFDDYFYPDNMIDYNDYMDYVENNGEIPKNEYNLMIISDMIKQVHKVCLDSHKIFGISPDGNIENNYNKIFADVRKWCSSSEYIDFIMPQVYYGFFNETKAFTKVIKEWESLIRDDSVKLRIALAFYKVGHVDNWAKSGSNEWVERDDIIMREIIFSRNLKNYVGLSLFRYDNLIDEEMFTERTINELENMKKVLS